VKGLDISTWWGVLAPANTPKDIILKLNLAINEVSNKDAIKGRLLNEGASIIVGSPSDFQTNLNNELSVWRNLVKTAGLKGSN
jgi:tripartite-type tricarboxylate transporter receptor subunit TctC